MSVEIISITGDRMMSYATAQSVLNGMDIGMCSIDRIPSSTLALGARGDGRLVFLSQRIDELESKIDTLIAMIATVESEDSQ